MKALVIYDSLFGNTQKIADAVAKGIGGKAAVTHVSKLNKSNIHSLDLLIVGSPTHGGRPSEKTQAFLSSLSENDLTDAAVAAFDTRFKDENEGFFLRMLMKMIQYAAPRIQKKLEKAGGRRAAEPTGFFVTGREGPLAKGELKRATKWAAQLRTQI